MTCVTFPFGDASWQPVVAVDDAALAPIVSAAEPFVAKAAASASRHPTASAQRTPNLLRLIEFSPLCRWRGGTYRDPFPVATARGEDVVATWLEPLRPGGAEEAPGLGFHEAHPVVHLLEHRLRGLARLLSSSRQQALELRLVAAELLVGVPDRVEELDHRLADVDLEGAVALAVVVGLDRFRPLGARDRPALDGPPGSGRCRSGTGGCPPPGARGS